MDPRIQQWIDASIRAILQNPTIIITDQFRQQWLNNCPELQEAYQQLQGQVWPH